MNFFLNIYAVNPLLKNQGKIVKVHSEKKI